jgi:hypothetical protein
MKNSHTENNSFSNNMSTNEKSEQETEEDYSSTATSSNKSNYKYRQKIRKRSMDICYILNFLERFGNIYITPNISKSFIAKIRKVNFDDNFQELFEKGKNNLGNYFKEDVSTIPDITFWYQRYYYYKRFDEGIQMDYESKFF